MSIPCSPFFFLIATPTTEIYTLSLHDALPISSTWENWSLPYVSAVRISPVVAPPTPATACDEDRKSTCLKSSQLGTSSAFSCLKLSEPPVAEPVVQETATVVTLAAAIVPDPLV